MTQQNIHIYFCWNKWLLPLVDYLQALHWQLFLILPTLYNWSKAMQMLHNFAKVIILQLLKNYVKLASSKISFSFVYSWVLSKEDRSSKKRHVFSQRRHLHTVWEDTVFNQRRIARHSIYQLQLHGLRLDHALRQNSSPSSSKITYYGRLYRKVYCIIGI